MKAYEYYAEVLPDGHLPVPEDMRKRLRTDSKVRVMLLLEDDDAAWDELTMSQSPAQIRKQGWEALVSQLGVAKSLRFLLEYEKGQGNYTELRKEMFAGQSVHDILDDMVKEGIIAEGSHPQEDPSGRAEGDRESARGSSV